MDSNNGLSHVRWLAITLINADVVSVTQVIRTHIMKSGDPKDPHMLLLYDDETLVKHALIYNSVPLYQEGANAPICLSALVV